MNTYRRNEIDAWSYEVATACGSEIWDAADLFEFASDLRQNHPGNSPETSSQPSPDAVA